ncbi:MAG: peptidase C56 [Alphaproteobacteria bacterium]|nr:peptidase C56 [Alphaproteobacteria bacterium]
MSSSLAGKPVAILVANGVDEPQLTEIQRALTRAGATVRTIAPEQGLVNSWHGDSWGHYYPVDGAINEALGSDFEVLVLPGGQRGIDKLKENLHTRRIVNHFLDAGKPISAIGEGVALLALGARIGGRTVTAPQAQRADLLAAGAEIDDDATSVDGNILTAQGPAPQAWVEETLQMVADSDVIRRAA